MADAARKTWIDWLGIIVYAVALLVAVVGVIAAAIRCDERGGALVPSLNWSISACVPTIDP